MSTAAGTTVVAAPASSHTLFFVAALVLVAVAAALGYYEWSREKQQAAELRRDEAAAEKKAEAAEEEEKAAEAKKTKEQTAKTKTISLTPLQVKHRNTAMAICESQNFRNGTCHYDVQKERYFLECKAPFFGTSCASKCVSTDSSPRKYTAGGDDRSPTPATCVCPPANHFSDTSIRFGCKAGDAQGSSCAKGYFGKMCDKTGAWKDCGQEANPPRGSLIDGACVCDAGKGFAGPDHQCKFERSNCTNSKSGLTDPDATVNPDGSCNCSPGYLSPPGSSGPSQTCDACDTDGGYYRKDDRCVTGTVCQMSVYGGGNTSALDKPGDLSGPKTYTSGDLGLPSVEYVQLKRTSGTEACAARIETASGCTIDVTLPTTKSQITSFPILTKDKTNVADADSGDIGRAFKSITIGTQTQVQTGGTPCSGDTFATNSTDFINQCPSAVGNACAYYYTDPV